MWKLLPDSLLSLVYPQECTVCHGEVDSLDDGTACRTCWGNTRIFDGSESLCSKCGAFLLGAPRPAAAFCHRCDEHYYDTAVAVGIYEKAISAEVLNLKRIPHLSNRVRLLFVEAFERRSFDDALVIPIPLSPRRMFERGFNQASILGHVIARHAGLILDEHTLVRTVHTPMHRAGMDRKARAMTVKKAFEVVRPKLISEKSVLLIDDVLTSGETASMCAQILKKNGAARVDVLTLARAA